MKITSKQLRESWLKFYESKGHVNVGGVSLIGDGTTGVMFNVAGMQPLMPYLLGKPHPLGKRLCNVQGCVRTVDIESVGDASHFTFFEMMGNWSLGDYFKKEKTAWTYELLTTVYGLDGDKLCSTVFEGNDAAPRDEETASLLRSLGIREEHIFYLPKSDNWWELEGTVGTPCGPDNEWFYPIDPEKKDPVFPDDYVEIGNDVYMQYRKTESGYVPLENKNVDTGFGLDRMLLFLNGLHDGYKTDLFAGAVAKLEALTGKQYDADASARKAGGLYPAPAHAPRHPLLPPARRGTRGDHVRRRGGLYRRRVRRSVSAARTKEGVYSRRDQKGGRPLRDDARKGHGGI